MHLIIQKKHFLRSLARTHSVADRKSSMPILSNILLSAENPKVLRCAATDGPVIGSGASVIGFRRTSLTEQRQHGLHQVDASRPPW